MPLFKSCLFLLLAMFTSAALANITSFFAQIKSDPKALYTFLKEMPKGGELHYHLAGGAYPETMLALAAKGNYCFDPLTSMISKTDTCHGVKAATLATKPDAYHKVIRDWSMQDFVAGQQSGHDHFFASFFKFMPVVMDFRPQLLAEVIKRAADQHELYMEIMILPDNAASTGFAKLIGHSESFADKQKILLANQDFQKNITHTREESTRILQETHRILGCDSKPKQPVCRVTVKFQYYILREQALDNMFAQALNGFAAAAASNNIIGVNLVQAEDGVISMRDYRAQMQVMKFMHTAYPHVHIALHAGELSTAIVSPQELGFHIRDAIFTGQAQRIGHGVDITYEKDGGQLIKHMADKSIAVEINLISNRKVLNIGGQEHPLRYYLANHVPVVLSTDDEGILRTDLTEQYVEAVTHHGLDYPTIKAINRNTLTYSFLAGKSLWADPRKSIRVKACQNLASPACRLFIKNSPKAQLQWLLENQLALFEQRYQAVLSTRHSR